MKLYQRLAKDKANAVMFEEQVYLEGSLDTPEDVELAYGKLLEEMYVAGFLKARELSAQKVNRYSPPAPKDVLWGPLSIQSLGDNEVE